MSDLTPVSQDDARLDPVFDAVVWLREMHDANIGVIAFKSALQTDFSVLYDRAGEIKGRLNLPAKSWVEGLKKWMRDQQT